MKDRIAHIIRAKNLTASEFATLLGVQPSGVSHILSGRNNPSLDFIKRIKECFPEYNLDWLVFGNGPMTGSDPHPISHSLFDNTLPIEPEEPDSLPSIESTPSSVIPTPDNLSGTLFDMNLSDTPSDNQLNTSLSSHENETMDTPTASAEPPMPQPRVKSILVLYEDGTFDTYYPRN